MSMHARLGVDRFFRQATWLDEIADPLQKTVRGMFTGSGPAGFTIRNFLNGVWLGHPLHAALSALPVGLFTGAVIFDVLGLVTADQRLKRPAKWCVGMGTVGALAAAVAGVADYSEVESPQRREATAHALVNIAGTLAFGLSLFLRFRGFWKAAIPFSTLGYALILVGSDLGGRLVFNLGTLVSREAFSSPPETFTQVLAVTELAEGKLKRVEANGMAILLAQADGQLYAIGDTCTHWGCSLAEGKLSGTTVECPCHGSRYDLRDGAVIQGPASEPELSFDVRKHAGQVEVRLSPGSGR
jgi:nitrite reductase/ring-hydroxylating ferredoxin subunit/uncharacterized membrane protein